MKDEKDCPDSSFLLPLLIHPSSFILHPSEMPISDPRENEDLENELPGIVGASEAMREVYSLTRMVAPTPTTVLLIGETGTGKEMVARAVHRLSPRADGP